jgi:hypothetical protein
MSNNSNNFSNNTGKYNYIYNLNNININSVVKSNFINYKNLNLKSEKNSFTNENKSSKKNSLPILNIATSPTYKEYSNLNLNSKILLKKPIGKSYSNINIHTSIKSPVFASVFFTSLPSQKENTHINNNNNFNNFQNNFISRGKRNYSTGIGISNGINENNFNNSFHKNNNFNRSSKSSFNQSFSKEQEKLKVENKKFKAKMKRVNSPLNKDCLFKSYDNNYKISERIRRVKPLNEIFKKMNSIKGQFNFK